MPIVMLWRQSNATHRSLGTCSHNDAIGDIAAALGVFGTGTAWPDIAVAVILAGLGVSGGWQVIRQARAELCGVASAGREQIAI